MSFFDPTPPTLAELIAHTVARSRERAATLNRTKLVKILYLLDVELVGSGRRAATGLEWVFFHYGPFAFALAEELDRLETSGQLFTRAYGNAQLYMGAQETPDAATWPNPTSLSLNRIVDRWAGEELPLLLDHVYFETAPMQAAERGDILNLSVERQSRRARERHRPLDPPSVPNDVSARMDAWRERRRQRYVTPPAAEAPTLLRGPEEARIQDGVHGGLSVPREDN